MDLKLLNIITISRRTIQLEFPCGVTLKKVLKTLYDGTYEAIMDGNPQPLDVPIYMLPDSLLITKKATCDGNFYH